MILPDYVFPSSLKIQWGMSKEECLTRLNVVITKQSTKHIVFKLLVDGNFYDATLRFNNSGGLNRVELHLFLSQPFDDDNWDETTTALVLQIEAEYKNLYLKLKEDYIALLGEPDFIGNWEDKEFPEDQSASFIAYWNNIEGRIQLEYDHPDKNFPVFVNLACYPI